MIGKNPPVQETAVLMNQALGAHLHLLQFPSLLCTNLAMWSLWYVLGPVFHILPHDVIFRGLQEWTNLAVLTQRRTTALATSGGDWPQKCLRETVEQAWVSFFSPLGGFLHLTHLQDLQDRRSSGGTSTDLVLPTETQGGSLLPRVW